MPEPFGPARDELRVEARTARAYRVRAGECIQIIDVQGQQCSDFMAVREDALARGQERYIDGTVTRTMVGGAYPGPGLYDKYFDQDMRPLLVVVQDTVGRHDTFGLACTARGYEERGFPDHANCSDNISAAYRPFGITERAAWPAINLFFNSWILPGDNRLRSDEGWSRPGDFVVLRALTDLICVTTACPADIDGINGWNPTDIHVRIYPPDLQIPAAVAYRSQPGAQATMSQPSAFHDRTSALTRHYATVRDLWLPTSYESTRALEEYEACRNAVTLQDMSALRKFDIAGPDAVALLDLCTTRDVRLLAVGRGHYTLVCDDAGAVIDDGTLFRMTPDVFRWFPSSELSALHMKDVAAERGLAAWVRAHDASLPNLSLQGPKSRELLAELVFIQPTNTALAQLKWFGCTVARLHDREGPAFMLTRSGYTGELGYEIFCSRKDALPIWDALMQAGERHGITPMGSEALGLLRVEAGLAAQGAEFGNDIDAFEAGLGFAVDLRKPAFIGKAALERIHAAPRRLLTGLVLAGNEAPAHGDGVFKGRQRVGTITSAVRSPALGCAIALARVAVEWAEAGHALEVGRLDGQMKRLACTTAPFPFVDPQRLRARA
ncbi:MAG: aminomethyltransferase family protein [Rubrivivax sp.]|nr:aminomethyltransferase family protein [Rubrivivax sp.]